MEHDAIQEPDLDSIATGSPRAKPRASSKHHENVEHVESDEASTTTAQQSQVATDNKPQQPPPRPLPAPPMLSFAERSDRRLRNKRSSLEPVPEGTTNSFAVDNNSNHKEHGEQRPLGPRPRPRKRLSKSELGRSHGLSSEDVFRTRDPCPAQDYAKNESMVLAEVQTNVIVRPTVGARIYRAPFATRVWLEWLTMIVFR
jgi:hypothetical protein